MSEPNILVYRDFGFTHMVGHTVRYVSTDGKTIISIETYQFHESCDGGTGSTACEQKFRTHVEYGDFWMTVNSSIIGGDGLNGNTEVVVGLIDGTTVAVTRPTDDGELETTARASNGQLIVVDDSFTWPDGQPVFESHDKGILTVNVAGETRISANYDDLDKFICEIHVMDGAKFRILKDPLVEHCSAGSEFHRNSMDASNDADDTYVVCRRNLSGYEFVDLPPDNTADEWSTVRKFDDEQRRPVTVVRTLTRSHFDDRTARLVDKMLADHYETIKTLAEKLNVEYLEANIGSRTPPTAKN